VPVISLAIAVVPFIIVKKRLKSGQIGSVLANEKKEAPILNVQTFTTPALPLINRRSNNASPLVYG